MSRLCVSGIVHNPYCPQHGGGHANEPAEEARRGRGGRAPFPRGCGKLTLIARLIVVCMVRVSLNEQPLAATGVATYAPLKVAALPKIVGVPFGPHVTSQHGGSVFSPKLLGPAGLLHRDIDRMP